MTISDALSFFCRGKIGKIVEGKMIRYYVCYQYGINPSSVRLSMYCANKYICTEAWISTIKYFIWLREDLYQIRDLRAIYEGPIYYNIDGTHECIQVGIKNGNSIVFREEIFEQLHFDNNELDTNGLF